jgi:hypothetical protein
VGSEKEKEKLSFFTKELREPKYKIVDSDEKVKPCEKFNRYYLPNGKLVEIRDKRSQSKALERLYLDNFKRQPYPYKCEFEGEQYHLVKSRDSNEFSIVVNEPMVGERKDKLKAEKF